MQDEVDNSQDNDDNTKSFEVVRSIVKVCSRLFNLSSICSCNLLAIIIGKLRILGGLSNTGTSICYKSYSSSNKSGNQDVENSCVEDDNDPNETTFHVEAEAAFDFLLSGCLDHDCL